MMNVTRLRSALSLACLSAVMAVPATSAIAQPAPTAGEFPSAVATFGKICLVPGVNPQDRELAISADPTWRSDQTVTVDVPAMNISRAIDRNYTFAEPTRVRQWNGQIDGQPARLVLASFDPRNRYPNLCAIVLEGPANAMPYANPLRDAFKAFGIGGKSVDLAHYFEFAGKVGPDKHPVRGEIFSRSQSGQTKNTTHIYVAY
ncbi:hypothetical protein [Novosphingobium sp.]|uniref:hypothetical protein n=1 Tax=Novosphingobium sp. TaxID=1874826 RepID=UPI002634D730|nr:hypothetical protein [Novosphingobium sp.]